MPTTSLTPRQETTALTTSPPYLEGYTAPLSPFLLTTIFPHSFPDHNPKFLHFSTKTHNPLHLNSSSSGSQFPNYRRYVHFLQHSCSYFQYSSYLCGRPKESDIFYSISKSPAESLCNFWDPPIPPSICTIF